MNRAELSEACGKARRKIHAGDGKGAADTDASWSFIGAALPVYRLFGAEKHIGWFNHSLGHRYGGEARPVAEAFFERHLR